MWQFFLMQNVVVRFSVRYTAQLMQHQTDNNDNSTTINLELVYQTQRCRLTVRKASQIGQYF